MVMRQLRQMCKDSYPEIQKNRSVSHPCFLRIKLDGGITVGLGYFKT